MMATGLGQMKAFPTEIRKSSISLVIAIAFNKMLDVLDVGPKEWIACLALTPTGI